MEEVFKEKPRIDRKAGEMVVVPTTGRFFEGDGSDVRMRRIYFYDPEGNLEKTILLDPMSVPWADTLPYEDDPNFEDFR